MLRVDEVVSVDLWRGYVTACFYARRPDSDLAIAVSPSFRILRPPWKKEIPLADDRRAVDALSELEQTLIEAGWQPVGGRPDAPWYQLSFGRTHGSRGGPWVDEMVNGHSPGSVAAEIVTALRTGPLASSELGSRVGRSSVVVRAAREELERAGLVKRASPPPGRSRRATYWKLSSDESTERLRHRLPQSTSLPRL